MNTIHSIKNWCKVEEEEDEELKCLGFRPQSRIGECEGCKAVCEECENLMIMEEEEIYCHNENPCGYNSYIYGGCDEWGTHEENAKWICKKCEEEDVCCVGCNERVCSFNEEPPHKDSRDEAVCDECIKFIE